MSIFKPYYRLAAAAMVAAPGFVLLQVGAATPVASSTQAQPLCPQPRRHRPVLAPHEGDLPTGCYHGRHARAASPIERRRVLQALLGLGVGTLTGTSAWGYFYERHGLRVTRTEVPVRGLPAGLGGLRIALLTDIHRSETVPPVCGACHTEQLPPDSGLDVEQLRKNTDYSPLCYSCHRKLTSEPVAARPRGPGGVHDLPPPRGRFEQGRYPGRPGG